MKLITKLLLVVSIIVFVCNSRLFAKNSTTYFSIPFYNNWVLEDKSSPLKIIIGKDTFVFEKRTKAIVVLENGSIVYHIKQRTLQNANKEILVSYSKKKIDFGKNSYLLLNDGKKFELLQPNTEDAILSIQLEKEKHKRTMVLAASEDVDVALVLFAAFLKYDLDIKSNDYWLYGLVGFWS